MKVYLPCDSKMSLGGGWRFRENLIKGAESMVDMDIVDSLEEADISLIAGATMILPETFTKLKEHGKVVLRLDGIPEGWRNEGMRTWGRFKHYFKESDGVVCQSEFVRKTTFNWLYSIMGNHPVMNVIMNGVDKSIFKPDGDKLSFGCRNVVLNVNSRKDENKRIEEVIARYRFEKLKDNRLFLLLAGKYPTYLRENDFGLYDYQKGQDWDYLGMIESKEKLAELMRSCDEFWFPSFADPCPNVLIEALHCGVEACFLDGFGGSREIYNLFEGGYDFGLKNMAKKYYEFFKEVLNG